jgi:methionine-rich copper-binding protein CopC
VTAGTRLRRLGAVLAVTALAALGTSLPAQSASAHNYVVSSTPAEGAVLTELPERFDVTTNDVLLDLGNEEAFAMQVTDAAGEFYGDGCVVIDGEAMSTEAALGAGGAYDLTWQAVSADGHTVSGVIGFTWQPPDGFEPADGAATAPNCGDPSSGVTDEEDSADVEAETEGSDASAADGTAPGDVLWLVGAAAAVVIAIVGTLLLTRRRE